jgi:hypothetical protein
MVLMLLACLPKSGGEVTQAESIETRLVVVAESVGDRSVKAAPVALSESLISMLAEHKLPATAVGGWEEVFQSKRTASARLAWLVEQGGEAQLVVSVLPEFYSLLSGRYRWTVGVEAVLGIHGEVRAESQFEVPVFLDYDHEREEAAIVAAVPVIVRRVEGMLEDR